ncbi:hypothetical protein [Leptospira interrogans]|nr:hypothetical protein [Leptospira interrogans]MCL8309401.1 hypothetical protein [Leptospira interrogans]
MYSDVFYAQTKFLCAPPTSKGHGTAMYDRTEVCFETFYGRRKLDPTKVRKCATGKIIGSKRSLMETKLKSSGVRSPPVLHDDPLEEMYGDDIEEHMTMGVVFLKWVNAQISDRPSKPK